MTSSARRKSTGKTSASRTFDRGALMASCPRCLAWSTTEPWDTASSVIVVERGQGGGVSAGHATGCRGERPRTLARRAARARPVRPRRRARARPDREREHRGSPVRRLMPSASPRRGDHDGDGEAPAGRGGRAAAPHVVRRLAIAPGRVVVLRALVAPHLLALVDSMSAELVPCDSSPPKEVEEERRLASHLWHIVAGACATWRGETPQ